MHLELLLFVALGDTFDLVTISEVTTPGQRCLPFGHSYGGGGGSPDRRDPPLAAGWAGEMSRSTVQWCGGTTERAQH